MVALSSSAPMTSWSLPTDGTRACSDSRRNVSATMRSRPMRNNMRALWLVFSTAWRADPRSTLGALGLESASTIGDVLTGIWMKLITDGALGHDPRALWIGIAGVASLYPVSYLIG